MSSGGIIDCDVHCAVSSKHDLIPHLPEQWQELVSLPTFGAPGALELTYPSWAPTLRTVGAELTLQRLREEVLGGVDLAVLYCYYGVEAFTHPYLAAAIASAVNDWLATAWLDADDRLRASAVVTPHYPQFAVDEIHRIANDARFVQVVVPARAPNGYGNQRYWPIWEAAAEHDLPVAITFGGAALTPPTAVSWLDSFYEFYVTGYQPIRSHIVSLVMSGLLNRCPNLKFVLAESGWTWLPALIWRMDQEWRAHWREVPWMVEPPSAYFRRHFRVTSQPIDAPVEHLAGKLEELPASLLMFGSDYPHRAEPGAEALLAALSRAERELVTRGNALEWYALDASRPEIDADGTGGPALVG